MAQVTTSAVSNEILASQRELLARMGEVATVTEANRPFSRSVSA